jgi:hypothetical protein
LSPPSWRRNAAFWLRRSPISPPLRSFAAGTST